MRGTGDKDKGNSPEASQHLRANPRSGASTAVVKDNVRHTGVPCAQPTGRRLLRGLGPWQHHLPTPTLTHNRRGGTWGVPRCSP